MRGYFVKLCDELHINPSDLFPKNVEDFTEKDITKNMAILRYNNYENKRRGNDKFNIKERQSDDMLC